MKMGRRLCCSSVTYRFRYAPSYRQSGSDRLAGGPFVSYVDAGGGEPFLKSVPVHAIDLRQIETSYKIRLAWVYIQRFLSETGNGGSTESKKSRASMPKRSREDLLASLRAILAAAIEFKSQRGTSSSRERF